MNQEVNVAAREESRLIKPERLHRSRRTRQVIALIIIFWVLVYLAVSVWGWICGDTFFVSLACLNAFRIPAVLFGVATAMGFLYFMIKAKRESSQRISIIVGILLYIIMPACFGSLSYIWMAQSVPMVLNSMVGKPVTEIDTISMILHRSGRDDCDRIEVKELSNYFSSEICVNKHVMSSAKPGERVDLSGSRSWFGFDVSGYLLEP